MSALRALLVGREPSVQAVSPEASVLEAVRAMCEHHVGALLVVQGNAAIGIVSARDVLRRVLLDDRDPKATSVGSIMTRDVTTVDADIDAETALQIMEEVHCHHLPVVVDGRVVGVLSQTEVIAWTRQLQEFEVQSMREYVSGVYLP